jgi:hypothetical protein
VRDAIDKSIQEGDGEGIGEGDGEGGEGGDDAEENESESAASECSLPIQIASLFLIYCNSK